MTKKPTRPRRSPPQQLLVVSGGARHRIVLSTPFNPASARYAVGLAPRVKTTPNLSEAHEYPAKSLVAVIAALRRAGFAEGATMTVL